MANVISDWRDALVTGLTTAFPNAEVRSGRRQGVSRDKDRINVFFFGWQETPDRVVVAAPIMVVRYWKQLSELPPDTSPPDPEPLEQASVDLLQALRGLQDLSTLTRPWYFRVQQVQIDEDPAEWGVEARLVAFTANLATIA